MGNRSVGDHGGFSSLNESVTEMLPRRAVAWVSVAPFPTRSLREKACLKPCRRVVLTGTKSVIQVPDMLPALLTSRSYNLCSCRSSRRWSKLREGLVSFRAQFRRMELG